MELEKSVLAIDAGAYVERLCGFISTKQVDLHRDGILVPFSGGLDSSTVLLLATRAAGKNHVKALLLPEKQGNPDALAYAQLLLKRFGIDAITRDISPILQYLGVYDFILARIPTRPLRELAAKTYLQVTRENAFLQLTHGQADALQRKGFARINAKHRIRSVVTYLIAEEMNYLVVGCAHKSEDMLGLFVKFGVDDNADLMPLKNLYRTQILQLATFLGVPAEIRERTPNPDIVPGVTDKYMDLLGVSSDTLDLVLYGIEYGLRDDAIAAQLNLPVAKVTDLRDLVTRTSHMRHPSLSLTWQ